MDTLWRIVLTEWRVIKDVPLSFVGAVIIATVLVGFTIWWAMEWRYRAQLENKEAEIAILEARVAQKEDIIQEVRRQLDGVPPEDVTGEISRLKELVQKIQDQIAFTAKIESGQRKIDLALANQMLTQLPRDKTIDIVAVMGDAEALTFATEINAFLRKNGFNTPHETNVSQAIFAGPVGPFNFDPSSNKLIVGSNK